MYYDYDYGLGIYYRMSIHSSAASKFLPFQAIHEDTTRSLRQEIADLRLRLKDVDALGSQSNDTGSKVRNMLFVFVIQGIQGSIAIHNDEHVFIISE